MFPLCFILFYFILFVSSSIKRNIIQQINEKENKKQVLLDQQLHSTQFTYKKQIILKNQVLPRGETSGF